MKRRPRLDANHHAVAEEFQARGCSWVSTAALGHGFPDAVVGWGERTALVEVKSPRGKLREAQCDFARLFKVWVVRDGEDVCRVVRWLKS